LKKSFKRLQLSRETLGALDRNELRWAAGASGGLTTSQNCEQASCDGGCEPTDTWGNTWEHTCTVLCCSSMAHC
jgi:hypothetical protein